MEWIIDRIEKNTDTGEAFAIIECQNNSFKLNIKFLPENIREGAVLLVTPSEPDTKAKEESAKELMERIFKK